MKILALEQFLPGNYENYRETNRIFAISTCVDCHGCFIQFTIIDFNY